MARELTPKQEKFVQGLFAGLSQRNAYKDAYDTSNMKDTSIDEVACTMAKSPKISSRLKELQNAVAEKNGWTREKLIKDFEKVKEKCLQEVEVTAFDKETGTHVGTGEYVFKEQGVIKALENIGKLLGMYEEKIKHSGEINIIKVKPPKFGKETEE